MSGTDLRKTEETTTIVAVSGHVFNTDVSLPTVISFNTVVSCLHTSETVASYQPKLPSTAEKSQSTNLLKWISPLGFIKAVRLYSKKNKKLFYAKTFSSKREYFCLWGKSFTYEGKTFFRKEAKGFFF